mmetsp:Transcript_8438/g.33351  ORF Transcript_8438/g.33351 Transcript_8438/m.33351 type:complete len:242 (+) Transcript_8438:582-1307(+)
MPSRRRSSRAQRSWNRLRSLRSGGRRGRGSPGRPSPSSSTQACAPSCWLCGGPRPPTTCWQTSQATRRRSWAAWPTPACSASRARCWAATRSWTTTSPRRRRRAARPRPTARRLLALAARRQQRRVRARPWSSPGASGLSRPPPRRRQPQTSPRDPGRGPAAWWTCCSRWSTTAPAGSSVWPATRWAQGSPLWRRCGSLAGCGSGPRRLRARRSATAAGRPAASRRPAPCSTGMRSPARPA